jgi:hypothetical protein
MNSYVVVPIDIIGQHQFQIIQGWKYLLISEFRFENLESTFGNRIIIRAIFFTERSSRPFQKLCKPRGRCRINTLARRFLLWQEETKVMKKKVVGN